LAILHFVASGSDIEADLELTDDVSAGAAQGQLVFLNTENFGQAFLGQFGRGVSVGARVFLVESNHIVIEGRLKGSVEFSSRKSSKPARLNAVNEFSVIMAVSFPFVLPEESSRTGLSALGRPEVLHVIQELRIFFDDGKVEVPIFTSGFGLRP
jgi:hypothetical protein